jgi:hypothetical protein
VVVKKCTEKMVKEEDMEKALEIVTKNRAMKNALDTS